MKIKFSKAACIGAIVGWFILAPVINPNINLSIIERLLDAIGGMALATTLGFLFGLLNY